MIFCIHCKYFEDYSNLGPCKYFEDYSSLGPYFGVEDERCRAPGNMGTYKDPAGTQTAAIPDKCEERLHDVQGNKGNKQWVNYQYSTRMNKERSWPCAERNRS